MAATELRNKGVDRRRLTMDQRESYRGGSRAGALARVKSYKANMAWNSKRRPFATEQKPGTGGFTGGIWQQQERLAKKGAELERSKQLRPQNYISDDRIAAIYR